MAKKNETVETRFSKEKIVSAKRYRNDVDLVNALLQDGVEYTFDEVDALIENYLKGKVN